jgi:hypothetical protein
MYFHNLLPQAFGNPWPTNAGRREEQEVANLRNSQELTIPFARTNLAQKMPLTLFPKIWNDFDNIVKYDPSKKVFSKKVKEHMFLQLSLEPICNRPNCPVCR